MPLILGFLGLALVVAAISTFLYVLFIFSAFWCCFLWGFNSDVICCRILRKRRRSREAAYQKVVELHDEEDEPPFMQYRDNSEAEMHALGRLQDTRYVEHIAERHVAEEHVVEGHIAEEHIAEEHIAEEHIAEEHLAEEHRT